VRIVIPTTGSLGDVQPYVALGLGLKRAGHRVRLATHADFESLIRGRGLDFFAIEDSSRALHRRDAGERMTSTGGNPFTFLRQFGRLRQPLMHGLMARTYEACHDADAILVSGTALLIGHAVAEKLAIPMCSAYLQPMGASRFLANSLFPHLPAWIPLGPLYNFLSHVVVAEFLWQLLRTSINKARQEVLDLPPLPFLGPRAVLYDSPILHGYSSAVIAKPRDWGENAHLTGYWFLDGGSIWKPPAALVDFLKAGPPPICVGFGSMPNRNAEQVTELVANALTRTRQRGVLLAGWGGLAPTSKSDQIFLMDAAPHDWLFPRMKAVIHHGGAGTTAAGIRAGVPSILIPYMADQPFWGHRVFRLGVGPRPIPRQVLSVGKLADAIRMALGDPSMRQRAAALGRRVWNEDGVARAVEVVEDYLGAVVRIPSRPRIALMPSTTLRNGNLGWRHSPLPSQVF
jgi:UDP:flavonoid glycosyltransferase YjiC (YdhE family)